MSIEGRIKAQINPLYIPGLEGEQAEDSAPTPAGMTLSFLCPPGTPNDAKSFVKRYRTISNVGKRLLVAPAEPGILEKLVWPLRNAKASYVLGNNLGVVALCGMVAEMVALLLWQLAEPELNGKALTEKDERALLGSSFEQLGQDRRVKILLGYGIVSQRVKDLFDRLRSKRRRYLHYWSQDHASLSTDAEECFGAATALVAEVIGQDFSDGTFMLNPKLVKYLQREGAYQPKPDSVSAHVE